MIKEIVLQNSKEHTIRKIINIDKKYLRALANSLSVPDSLENVHCIYENFKLPWRPAERRVSCYKKEGYVFDMFVLETDEIPTVQDVEKMIVDRICNKYTYHWNQSALLKEIVDRFNINFVVNKS